MYTPTNNLIRSFALACTILVASCGGGSSNTQQTTTAPDPVVVVPPALPASAPIPPTTPASSPDPTPAPTPKPKRPVGLWATEVGTYVKPVPSVDDVEATSSWTQFATIASDHVMLPTSDPSAYPTSANGLADKAIANKQKVMFMLWTMLIVADFKNQLTASPDTFLTVGWTYQLAALLDYIKTLPPDTVVGYYLYDEPFLQLLNSGNPCDQIRISNTLAAIAAALPQDSLKLISLSYPEIDGTVQSMLPATIQCFGKTYTTSIKSLIGNSANVLTGNLYVHDHPTTWKQVIPQQLEALAQLSGSLNAKLALTLDAGWPVENGQCKVTDQQQQDVISNDKVLRSWADSRTDVLFELVFVYTPTSPYCGVTKLPLVLDYLRD